MGLVKFVIASSTSSEVFREILDFMLSFSFRRKSFQLVWFLHNGAGSAV